MLRQNRQDWFRRSGPTRWCLPAPLVLGFACMSLVCSSSCSSSSSSTGASLTAEDERLLEQVIEERKGKVSWAAGGMPLLDQLMPETSLKERWPLYTQVEGLAEKYGLQGLARSLINHNRHEFRRLGIHLVAYHRLIGLTPDLMRLLKQENTSLAEKDDVLVCLAETGTGLERVLSSLKGEPLKVRAVVAYANARSMAFPLENVVNSNVDALLKDAKQSTKVRQTAWRVMVAARRHGKMWYGDQQALYMRRGLELPQEQEIAGWVSRLRGCLHAQGVAEARNVAFAAEQVKRFLDSENRAARLEAAVALLQTEEGQAQALTILIGLVPEFNEPLPIWGSIGYRAIRTLGGVVEQGAFLRNALDGLPSEQQRRLMTLVGREQIPPPEEIVHAVNEFLGPESKANTKAKVQVAQIVASALSRELERRSSP